MVLRQQRYRVPVFGAVAALVAAVEWFAVHHALFSQSRLIPLAVWFDLTFVLPGLFWLLVLRPARRSWLEIGPVLVASGIFASVLLASRPDTKGLVLLTSGVGEILGLILIVRLFRTAAQHFRQSAAQDDFLLRIDSLPGALRLLAMELPAFYYACAGPRVKRPLRDNEFSYHEKSGLGGLLFGLGFVTVAEGLVVQVLVHQRSPAIGWVLLALHLYMLIWLVAAAQAARLRPIVVGDESVLIRTSLLATVIVPRTAIATITPLKEKPQGRQKGLLRAYIGTEPQWLLTLEAPVVASGPFGTRPTVDRIAVAVDEPQRFRQALEAARPPSGP